MFPLLFLILPSYFVSLNAQDFPVPINGLTAKSARAGARPLAPPPLRAADVMWQKTVWRVIDVREKINQPFAYPERPLYTILTKAAERNAVQLYANDDFSEVLSEENRQAMRGTVDTVLVTDPRTFKQRYKVIVNHFSPDEIKRYRIKEIWYVDRQTATLNVRIMGISPLREQYDENGNFLYELPLFWVYYPAAIALLNEENAPTHQQLLAGRSWYDLFESRAFSSSIVKADNIHDRKLGSYLSGRDAVLAGEKIDREIFNFEHDLWAQ